MVSINPYSIRLRAEEKKMRSGQEKAKKYLYESASTRPRLEAGSGKDDYP